MKTKHKSNTQEGFVTFINYSTFFNNGANNKDSLHWSITYQMPPNYVLKIEYLPLEKFIIINRPPKIDTFVMVERTKEELAKYKGNYEDFKLIGAFENTKLPFDFRSVFYYNPLKQDVLEIFQRNSGAIGNFIDKGAMIYLKDSINYMKNNRLFKAS